MTNFKFFIALFCFLCASIFQSNKLSAQVYSAVGVGLVYGLDLDSDDVGTAVRCEFHLAPVTTIVPNYIAFPDLKLISTDVHYKWYPESQLLYYPIAGVNLAFIEETKTEEAQTKAGVNLGLGASLALGEKFTWAIEFKAILGDKAYKQNVVNGTLMFHIN